MAQGRLTPREWRDYAIKARSLAATLHDPIVKHEILKIAEAYERLAERAETRDRG